jgi:uncharacterized pyridoxamine 5'-phosphate oxidase family protein
MSPKEMTETSYMKIKKFNGTNFHTWKRNVQMILMAKELWYVMDYQNQAKASFKTDTEKALAIIYLNLESSYQSQLDGCENALEAWTKLEE